MVNAALKVLARSFAADRPHVAESAPMTRSLRPALRPAMLISLACLSAVAVAPVAQAQGLFGRRKPAPAAAVVAAPPPAAALPPVALSGPVMQAAGAYRAYMRKASAIGAGFTDGRGVETSLEAAEASEPLALSRGVVAYAAVLALQEPSFVDGVRTYAADPAQRRQVADRLAANPAYAASMPGAAAAAALIARVLAEDAAKVQSAGAKVKQAAYDVQKQKWSTGEIPDRPGRLARAKTLAAATMSATPEEMAELAAAIPSGQAGQTRLAVASAVSTPVSPPYTSTIARGLAVAALAALGEGGDANDAAVQILLNDAGGSFCHNMAKLNLYQCLAVAKPYYEDVFCLGQHILLDTAQCVAKGSGFAPAIATAATLAEAEPVAAPAAKTTGRPAKRTKR